MTIFFRFYVSCLPLLITGLLLLICAQVLTTQLSAQSMKSDSFQVTFGNFNVTSGEKSSASYNLTDTVGQLTPGQFTGTGYVVKSGFQYIYPFHKFSFKISKLSISFGEIFPGSFVTDTHSLIVDTDGAGGYSVQAAETHPLRLQAGTDTIPDTTCDSGTCSQVTADSWINPINDGFGFNVQGDDVSADFLDANYFRQFADLSNAEQPQTIMSANTLSQNRNATVTYKVAPSTNQTAGLYETLVMYRAIPTY